MIHSRIEWVSMYHCESRNNRVDEGVAGDVSHREMEDVVQVVEVAPRSHVTRALMDARRVDADADAGTLPSVGLGPPSREASGRLCWRRANVRPGSDSIDPR